MTGKEPTYTGTLKEAYIYCERIARGHYENFPVGSVLIPRALRPHFYSVYAFSRGADDIADEGEKPPEERVAELDVWEENLNDALAGHPHHPIFAAVAHTVSERQIPVQLLRDLLTAFRIDARNEGYGDMGDLLRYCSYSANPIGRIVLAMYGLLTPERGVLSDKICTALQLANFWQDVSVDVPRGRFNIPLRIMERFSCTTEELKEARPTPAFREMMAHLLAETAVLFDEGIALLNTIPDWRLRKELALTIAGGRRILAKIEKADSDVLTTRPIVGVADLPFLIGRTLFPKMG